MGHGERRTESRPRLEEGTWVRQYKCMSGRVGVTVSPVRFWGIHLIRFSSNHATPLQWRKKFFNA
jgi:hypothetical protein